MAHEAIKLELIEWLAKLEDYETIEYLKVVKDSKKSKNDWWNELTDIQRQGIEKGLRDIDQGKTYSHDEVKEKYGL